MSEDRNDPIVRQGALLLSSLVLTPDDGLASYAKRRVTLEGVTVEEVRAARDLLDAVGFALRSEKKDDWRKIQQALAAVRSVAKPVPKKEEPLPPTTAPDSPMKQAEKAAAEPAPASTPIPAAPAPTPMPAAPAPTPMPVAPAPAPMPVAPAPAPVVAPPQPPASLSAPAAPAASEVNATGFLNAAAIQAPSEALPFQDGPAVAPESVADKLPARTSNIDETSALGHKLDFSEAATPFEDKPPASQQAPASAPSLSLQQYASFCTERTRAGLTGSAAVAQRYGLADAAAVAAVDAHWGSQLSNPTIKTQFDKHCQEYGDWLAAQGR